MNIKGVTVFLLAITGALITKADPPVEEGKSIFMTRCAGCHHVNKIITGPALAGVGQRHSIAWIVNFVHSSQTVIKGGDKDAMALFEKFNKIPMPDHPDLTADNIRNIVEFIKSETRPETARPPFDKPGALRPNYMPISSTDYGFFIVYVGSVLLLIAILVLAVRVKEMQRGKGV